jgi:hypothetical protein
VPVAGEPRATSWQPFVATLCGESPGTSLLAQLDLTVDLTRHFRRQSDEFNAHAYASQAVPHVTSGLDFYPGHCQPESQIQHRPFGKYPAGADEHSSTTQIWRPKRLRLD